MKTLDKEQRSLAAAITRSSLAENERFEIVLGTTCHAIYHAGQAQLIKALRLGAKG